jgi:hypothetical protein
MSAMRKASPEALALMMKNMKTNKVSSKVWVPSGSSSKKDSKNNA